MLGFAPAAHNKLRDRLKQIMDKGAFYHQVEAQKLKRLAMNDRVNARNELERLTGHLASMRMPAMRALPLEMRRRELIAKFVQ